jgi:carbon storage regulator
MLVLSRRKGERICIGDGIIVTVITARGGKARIGIEAPPEMPVDREEICERKNAEVGKTCGSRLVASHPR